MSLSTLALYNEPEYSDVTIQFSGRTVHCHKLVLCTKSDYFKKLCGPGSHFAEGNTKVIELKEDDPDAVEYLLRYLYSGQSRTEQDNNWQLQLEVAKTAQKYLILDLAAIAKKKFVEVASATIKPEEVFATITHIQENTSEADYLKVAQQLETKHLLPLLKVPGYRDVIDQDKSVMWNHLDRLRDSLSRNLEGVDFAYCLKCMRWAFFRPEEQNPHACIFGNKWERRRIWIPAGEFGTFEQLLPLPVATGGLFTSEPRATGTGRVLTGTGRVLAVATGTGRVFAHRG